MLTKIWTLRRSKPGTHARLLRETTLPVMMVGIVLLAAGVYGAWRVHRLHKGGSDILSENVASIRAAEEFETVVLEMRYRLKRYLSTENPRHLEELSRLLDVASRWQRRTRELAKSTREQQLVDRFEAGFERLVADVDSLESEAWGTDETLQMIDQLADEVIPHDILGFTKRYIQLNEEQLAESNEQNRSTANRLMFGLILLGTSGGVAGMLAGYLIARRVSRTIVQLSLPIQDTAGKLGKVVGPVSITADPSFEDLESMLKTVATRVATVVERLQESEREMLRAEQLAALGRLAAGLAHELRNPLTSLKAILQLAETPEDLTARDLDVLKQEITRLEDAVQSLLDFARPPQPAKRLSDLQSLVLETIDLVSRGAERKSVELLCEAKDEAVWVMLDAVQTRQLILNLLLNALDAVSIGGAVEVKVDVVAREQTGATGSNIGISHVAVVRVLDNGPGLPSQLEHRIFDPFFSTKEAGVGLGLSICKRILEAHGGSLAAQNRPEGGAVFTVSFPLSDSITPPEEIAIAKTTHS